MDKKYKIIAVGIPMNIPFSIKQEFIVTSSSRKYVKQEISKRYESLWSVNIELLILDTIKLAFKNSYIKLTKWINQ